MKIEVRVEATPNERRRFLGRADITPVIEVVSIMLDSVSMAFANARLASLEAEGFTSDRQDEL